MEISMKRWAKLNVGGRIFCTTKQTLVEKSDYFQALLSGSFALDRDDMGAILLDRDGDVFVVVLNYLRSGTIVNPLKFDAAVLRTEFDFYGVDLDKALLTAAPERKQSYLLQVDIALAPTFFSLAVFVSPDIKDKLEKLLAQEEVKELLGTMDVSIAVSSTWCYSYEKKNASSANLRIHTLLDALTRAGFELVTSTSMPTPSGGQRHIHSFTYDL